MKKPMLLAILLLLNLVWPVIVYGITCSVSSSGLSFGSFNPLIDNTADSTGTLTVTCDLLENYTIALSHGGGGSYSPRRMASSGNYLYYNLYLDPNYNQIWGDGTGGSYMVSDAILVARSKNHTVYGRIPLSTQRGAGVGSYSDSISVTITY